ncbi:MAG: cold-shock protein [Acidobacteriota bacterium]|jgi:CspA family cold shock protein|nr:cold-shock protein [Acidobacteriota bacterium]
MSQHIGKVMWFNNSKGFAFLSQEGAPDVFAHFSAIAKDGYKSLVEGDEESFDIIQGDRGPQADDVRPLRPEGHPRVTSSGDQEAAPPDLSGA